MEDRSAFHTFWKGSDLRAVVDSFGGLIPTEVSTCGKVAEGMCACTSAFLIHSKIPWCASAFSAVSDEML